MSDVDTPYKYYSSTITKENSKEYSYLSYNNYISFLDNHHCKFLKLDSTAAISDDHWLDTRKRSNEDNKKMHFGIR